MKISLNNRERLANEIVNGAVIIHGNNSVYRNNDVGYPFRQDSNFHYLTEWPEPDAHAVIVIKDSKPDLYMFVQDRNLEMETWDGKELPSEEVFAAFLSDYRVLAEKKEHGKLGQRLNKEKNGFNTILKKLWRKMKKFEEGNAKEQIMAIHKRFRDVKYWQAIKRTAPPYTMSKYLKGMDMYYNEDGKIVQVSEDRRIHRILWLRTLEVAFFVTVFCFLIFQNRTLDMNKNLTLDQSNALFLFRQQSIFLVDWARINEV